MHRVLGWVPVVLTVLASGIVMGRESERRLYDFHTNKEKPIWRAENDSVMGGVSEGRGEVVDGRLVFSGRISLENNGGFASLQTDDDRWKADGAEGFRLRVKGDGRTYQFRVATEATYRGSRIDYKAEFQTQKDEWTVADVRFTDMKPVWRGRNLDGPELDTSHLRQLRILLGDKKPGFFRLEVDWIEFLE